MLRATVCFLLTPLYVSFFRCFCLGGSCSFLLLSFDDSWRPHLSIASVWEEPAAYECNRVAPFSLWYWFRYSCITVDSLFSMPVKNLLPHLSKNLGNASVNGFLFCFSVVLYYSTVVYTNFLKIAAFAFIVPPCLSRLGKKIQSKGDS